MSTFYPKYYYTASVGTAESSVKPRWLSNLIDFSVQNVATTDTAVKMIPLLAGSILHTANYRTVTTVTSASGTFVLSDGTNTLVASAVAVAAGSWGVTPTIARTTTNIYYASAASVQLDTFAAANLTVGQIQVWALVSYPTPNSYVDVDGNTKTYTYTDRNNWVTTAPTIP